MRLYTYEDEKTGMKVQAESDTPLSGEDVDWLFGAAQKNAQQKLSDGSFEFDQEGVEKLGKDEKRKQVRRLSAQALGTAENQIDIDSGASLWERTKMDFLPDEGSRMEYLEKKYGAENVNALNIGGKTKMFYRDPKSNKMTMVDEMGASLADFTADIAGEAVTTAGAVGGAIVGTLLAPGVGTIAGATAGAALGGFATGVTQDVVAEALAGQDLEVGQKVKTRGIEAAIGVPIDLATAGIGRFFSSRLASGTAKNLISEVDSAVSRVDSQLSRMGNKRILPQVEALRTGEGSKQASEIAAARPNSKLAKNLQSVRDRLGEYRELMTNGGRGVGATVDDFNRVSDGVAQTYKKLIDDVGQIDKGLAKELQDQASRKMRKLSAQRVSEADAGLRLQGLLKRAEGKSGAINDQNWKNLDAMAQEFGVNVSGRSIAQSIKQTARQMAPLENKQLIQLADEIAKKENISFTELRGWISRIQDSVPESQAGFKTAQQVSIAAGKNVRELRDKIAGQAGEAFEKQYNDTINYYLDDYLNFKRQAVGGALKETSGAMTQPELAVRGILSNASGIKAALRAARQGGAGEEKALRDELRELYLNRVGLIGDVDPKSMNLQYNDDIVRELWGDRQIRELRNLQNRLKQAKDVKIAELTQEDIYKYLSALSGKEKGDIAAQIIKRAKLQNRLATQKNAVLLKKLRPKYDKQTRTWLEPEITGTDLANVSKDFVGAKNSQVQTAMKLLEDQGDEVGMQAFRQSYIGNLFDRFSAGAQVDRFGNPLWNPAKFEQAMKKGSPLRNNLETILGKEGADDILAANRVLLEASETTGNQVQEIFQPRYSIASGGLQLYGVGNLIGGLRGRALAWAYGSKRGSQLMRFLVNKGDDKEAEKILTKLLPALMTSSGGLKAAAIQGEFDPEFTERVAPLFEGMSQESPNMAE